MKNRKYPVMLFGVVVIAIGVMTVVNGSQRPQTPEAMQEQMQQASEESLGEHKLSEQDRAKAAQSILSRLETDDPREKKAKGLTADTASLQNTLAVKPTIFVSTTSNFRPEPNDAAPLTHWYDESSRGAKLAEENEKSKG